MAFDWSAVANAAGGLLGSVTSGLFGYFGNKETNKTNEGIANQNLQFQRENLDYEKALQKEIFQREDTAYQRTVNDMRLAGLNPLSMQGTNGAGEVIATEPQHNDFQFQNQLAGVFDTMNAFMNMKNNTSLSNAQANLINAQADNQRIKNKYEEDILINALESSNLENVGKKFRNERDNVAWLNDINNYAFNRQFGVSDNMPEFAKMLNIATHQGKLKNDWYTGFDRRNGGFGKTFNTEISNPSFNNLENVLNNTNLKGALMENKLGSILLQLLGIK